jgi:hypothetical protein
MHKAGLRGRYTVRVTAAHQPNKGVLPIAERRFYRCPDLSRRYPWCHRAYRFQCRRLVSCRPNSPYAATQRRPDFCWLQPHRNWSGSRSRHEITSTRLPRRCRGGGLCQRRHADHGRDPNGGGQNCSRHQQVPPQPGFVAPGLVLPADCPGALFHLGVSTELMPEVDGAVGWLAEPTRLRGAAPLP